MKAKRVITIVACVVMMLAMTACGGKNSESDVTGLGGSVQIPNPWSECADISEAVKNAGFSFEIPGNIEGYKLAYVQNMGKEMIDVIFNASDDSDKTIHIRKGTGTDDISGDYNTYAESSNATIGGYDVTLKGNEGSVSLATWTKDGYSYALSTPEMSAEAVSAIIEQIK